MDPSLTPRGRVYLVGAGPGDPDLLTLRGRECLVRADLVLYDYLVNPQILEHVRPEAERICLGRHGHGRLMPQAEINERMVRAAQAGLTVVRLKGGDPAVFARGAEELDALVAAQVPFEIVPGITAALAAGSYAGIPITHRELASGVALVTGQEDEGKGDPAIDYGRLANFPGTIVVYMGVTTAAHWSRALIAAGKPAATPAAVVRRCSWPDQQTIVCTLGEIPDVLGPHKLRPPVIVIIGEVVRLSPSYAWFAARPLFGQTVLVTRPLDQARDMRRQLAELGANVLVQPAIEITEPADWGPVDAALARLSDFDWLVFSSANGVRALVERLLASGRDVRALGNLRLAAIGPATAEALAAYHLHADLFPDEYRAEALAARLCEIAGPMAAKAKFLLARASRGREVLAEELTQAGAAVEQIVVYTSRDVAEADPEILTALRQGRIAWTTATSSAIARSMVKLFGDDLRQTKLVSISPLTSDVLRELGHSPAAEARQYTTAGMIEALLAAEAGP